jgi:hypothetical protein
MSDAPLTIPMAASLRCLEADPEHPRANKEGIQVAQEQQPQPVASNDWGKIAYYPQWKTMELKWLQSTRSMSDVGFRQTLELLADEGLKLRPAYMIIDATEFTHDVADTTFAWRNERIIPKYNQAGIQKFAFLVTDQAPGTVEKGTQPAPDGPASFPTAWFESRDRMYAWLTA